MAPLGRVFRAFGMPRELGAEHAGLFWDEGRAEPGDFTGIVDSLRLVEGESQCDGWLELAIIPGNWHRVPGEVLLERNFSRVCNKLGCGGLDKTDAVAGPVRMLTMSESEQNTMKTVIHTVWKITNPTQKVDDTPDILDMWLVTTGPTDIPHGAAVFCSGGCPEKGRLLGP
ncbi:hypothetical protein WISP_00083 [Willisornis vidua]|uniref:SRCR domain-containing protein n=1 Tax=Willisornis vidua TaxID=1566151 RepID=A0ABQ9E191_9PASS|nr:hypothetical protein WISP_00083 [Willisornis vidua]